jgi:hypothetical protein
MNKISCRKTGDGSVPNEIKSQTQDTKIGGSSLSM